MDEKLLNKELIKANQEIGVEKYKTAIKKVQFINEIKNGLGNEIKKTPNQVKIIKKSWNEKLKLFFKNIFTKF